MKRTNVILDEKLLEDARKVIGERTYSGTITKALEEVVRLDRLKKALEVFQREAAKGDFFWPGYLEEIRPNSYGLTGKRKVSAHQARAPRKGTARRRDSR